MTTVIPSRTLGRPVALIPSRSITLAVTVIPSRFVTLAQVVIPSALMSLEFDESKHPRDSHGRFGTGGGGADAVDLAGTRIPLAGTSDGKGTPDDPIYTDGNIDKAIEFLGQGKHVRLDTEKQAGMLVGQLGAYAKELHDRGERAGNFDLCGVSVAGSNLFCEGNLGVPRIEMPQLRGQAVDGSPAAGLRKDPSNSNESVSIEDKFTQALRDSSVSVKDVSVNAEMLRPTQSEINGAQAGYLLQKMLAGKFTQGPIWTTSDGYILDGHHRYVAEVAKNLLEGGDGNAKIPTHEVGMEIGAAIDATNAFAREQGLKQKSALVAAGTWDESKHPRGQPGNKGQFGPGDGSSEPKTIDDVKAIASRRAGEIIGRYGETDTNTVEAFSKKVPYDSKAGALLSLATSSLQAARSESDTQHASLRVSGERLLKAASVVDDAGMRAQLESWGHELLGYADQVEPSPPPFEPYGSAVTLPAAIVGALANADVPNGPWSPEGEHNALAARTAVAQAGGGPIINTYDRWESGYHEDIARGAVEIASAQVFPNYDDNHDYRPEASLLLAAVNQSAPIDGSLVRGLKLTEDQIPKVGATIVEPLSSWSREPAVANLIMDMRSASGWASSQSERVMLTVDAPKAVPVSALAPLDDNNRYASPGVVTSQEFLSGGQFVVDSVEKTTMMRGGETNDHHWMAGVAGATMFTDGRALPIEKLPVTVVHVRQVATYASNGEVVQT